MCSTDDKWLGIWQKLYFLTAGGEIVNQICDGCQGLPPLMKERTDYRETCQKWVTNGDQKKTFYIQMKV